MNKLFLTDAEAVKKDAENITYSNLSIFEGGCKEIKRSLNLKGVGECGSEISWQTSDERYITNSGRVIRPFWYEQNALVNMTATIKMGDCAAVKTFKFVVLRDEGWSDPAFMTDEEFFGVFSDGAWCTKGKLDYGLPSLKAVCEAAKRGDYELAKVNLKKHFANREPKSIISDKSQNKLWADALLDDFYHLQAGGYFQGDMLIGNEWDIYSCDLHVSNISAGGISSFAVRSRYNESSYAQIKRHNDENAAFRPKIQLLANGEKKEFFAIDSAVIRAGKYRSENYDGEKTLHVQTFGDFLGDDTYHAIFKFDFSDLESDADISDVKLVVYARACPDFSKAKRLIVLKEPSTTWNGTSAAWSDFLGCVYSYNGLPGKNDWINRPEGSDIEYWYQMCRFNGYITAILPEYLETNDETYMYKMLSIISDYLHDTGNYTMSDTKNFCPDGIRGGFARSLDAAIKNENFMAMLEVIAKSNVATSEIFTAILKNIWDTTNFLMVYNTPYNNWRQSEFGSVLQTTVKVPEFYDVFHGKNWRKIAAKELEDILFLNNLDDGSYSEAACGYSFSAFSQYVKHKIKMQELSLPVSKEYDALLHKCAYYIALLFTPDGRQLQYGDNGVGRADMGIFDYVCRWYNDSELEYIVSKGKRGKKPGWTSRHWEKSTVTVMRSDWTENSPYLFTNVRGGGAHGHCDYNGVIVCAGGRTLLNDAGIFTYTGTDPYRKWGTSTLAHNSVVINDTSQVHVENAGTKATGKVYDWFTCDCFDFLSQSTPNNPGFEHRRSILFIKPKMWIVSDLLIPENKEIVNNYKQTWHMLPSAGLKISDERSNIYSTYGSGVNIIVSNADLGKATVKMQMGYYDQSYQQIQNAPYGYFEKNEVGNTTFDTVLLPIENAVDANVLSRKIETEDNATALKLEYTLDGKRYTGYYFLSFGESGGRFGKYLTDGTVAYIEEDENENVTHFLINGGTYIKNEKNGKVLKN